MGKAQKIFKALLAGGAGVAALAAVNAAIGRREMESDESALGGEAGAFAWKYGRVFYRVAGAETAAPLVLIHGIGAGASSFMWRRNFDALARDFRVYALDLLGFGLSEKPAHAPYSADLYVELLADFLVEVAQRPAQLAASGLSGAFAVRLADEYAELVDSLILLAPALADATGARPDVPGAAFYGLLHSPVLGASFYNAMTSERGLRDYARRHLFYDQRFATQRLVAQHYAASHQPGAQYAIAAFLSGYLHVEARAAFARLPQPLALVWGREDLANPLARALELVRLNPRARLEIFERCRMMPQEEHPEKFNALVRESLRAQQVAA